jgi:hypothetical protein
VGSHRRADKAAYARRRNGAEEVTLGREGADPVLCTNLRNSATLILSFAVTWITGVSDAKKSGKRVIAESWMRGTSRAKRHKPGAKGRSDSNASGIAERAPVTRTGSGFVSAKSY